MSSKNGQTASRSSNRDLSPRQVAEAIGVSASSLKRWCDRGDLETTKTAGGHRRIPLAAVVRFLRERGYDAKRPDLLGLPAGAKLDARSTDEVLPQVVEALAEGDEARLGALFTGLYLANRSLASIADQFLQPAFAEIGRRWEAGELEVYREHRAVVIARNALSQLRALMPAAAADAPLAVSATLEGDPYLLPISVIELVLREVGWRSIVLGPNHPRETLCAALRELRPRLVCINVSFIPDREQLQADVAAIYSLATQLGIAVAIGGGRIDDELRRGLACTAHCASMAELASLARGLEPAAIDA